MSDIEDNDRYRAPALDKGLDILELLASIDGGLTQAEIAKSLGRTPNEFYRMLDRLVRRGYVARTADDRYELTLRLFALAHQHAPLRRLVSQAMPILRSLSASTLQACHLAVFDRGHVIIIAQIDSPGYWGLSIRVGARVGLFNTGSGHVLLAFRSAEERALMVAEYERVVDDTEEPDNIAQRLAQVRARGFEAMPSRQTAGVHNLSAPVLGPDGNAIAALTVPYLAPLNQPFAPDMPETIRLVMEAARQLSEMVGGRESIAPQLQHV
ncbi:IclR family transcriptional regulator [Chthonobacter albigriseus]|uniref:IclR family transcriptional regulator n=1 Tax=Chthonobacter albigriseus TaxID=1683161 RepID=UPI0015EEFE38|nr:IclR family transcriptional regulator [Chthonobacter albigriseus]